MKFKLLIAITLAIAVILVLGTTQSAYAGGPDNSVCKGKNCPPPVIHNCPPGTVGKWPVCKKLPPPPPPKVCPPGTVGRWPDCHKLPPPPPPVVVIETPPSGGCAGQYVFKNNYSQTVDIRAKNDPKRVLSVPVGVEVKGNIPYSQPIEFYVGPIKKGEVKIMGCDLEGDLGVNVEANGKINFWMVPSGFLLED